MLRGLLLTITSGCSLYFGEANDAGGPAGDAMPGDSGQETPAIDDTTPPEACTPIAVTLTPPTDPADPAFGCTVPAVASNRWIVFDSDRDLFNRDLYVMRADGTHLCRLTAGVAVDRQPAPSFDGTKIAFSSNRSGSFQIHLLDFETGAVTKLTTKGGEEPAFSHDGTLIAFRRGTAIYTIRTNGTDETKIADSMIDEFNAYANPQFSLDDTELYFDRSNELDAIRRDGTGLRMIVHNWTTRIRAPSITSNGLAVAYEVMCPDSTGIWLTSAQTSSDPCTGRRATPVDTTRGVSAPAIGPDDIIAFERVVPGQASDIALVDTEPGSQLCPITSALYDHRNPAWLTR